MHGLTESIAHLTAWLVAVFAVLSILDILSTSAFRKRGIAEANDWLDGGMKGVLERYGAEGLFVFKYGVFLLIFGMAGEGLLRPAVLAGICLAQAGVVAWNLYIIWRKRNA